MLQIPNYSLSLFDGVYLLRNFKLRLTPNQLNFFSAVSATTVAPSGSDQGFSPFKSMVWDDSKSLSNPLSAVLKDKLTISPSMGGQAGTGVNAVNQPQVSPRGAATLGGMMSAMSLNPADNQADNVTQQQHALASKAPGYSRQQVQQQQQQQQSAVAAANNSWGNSFGGGGVAVAAATAEQAVGGLRPNSAPGTPIIPGSSVVSSGNVSVLGHPPTVTSTSIAPIGPPKPHSGSAGVSASTNNTNHIHQVYSD